MSLHSIALCLVLQPGKQGTAASQSGGKDGDDDDDDDTPPPVVAPRPEHTKSVSRKMMMSLFLEETFTVLNAK